MTLVVIDSSQWWSGGLNSTVSVDSACTLYASNRHKKPGPSNQIFSYLSFPHFFFFDKFSSFQDGSKVSVHRKGVIRTPAI